MIIPLLELFDVYKETSSSETPNLTEENIYSHSHYFLNNNYEKVPVLSGSIKNDGIIGFVPDMRNKEDETFHEECRVLNSYGLNYYKNKKEGCITIVADGVYAGYSFFRSQNDCPIFCSNISCLILFKKKDNEIRREINGFDGLNLEWFNLKFHNLLKNILRGAGVKHFTKTICESIEELEIPRLETQNRELLELRKLHTIKTKFNYLCNWIDRILSKEVNGYTVRIEDEFSEIFYIEKGTSRFTEEAIYHSLPLKKHKQIPVFGGEKYHINARNFVKEKAINKEGNPVKYFKGECLILSLDGSSGCMTYKNKNEGFTLNHHAACLKLKKKYENRINIKWFKYSYQNTLVQSSVSKKSSRTLSKKILEPIIITAPDIKEQEEWTTKIKELENIKSGLNEIRDHVEVLLEKKIIS